MRYGNFKDLSRRTISDKILHDKAFNIGYQEGLASMVYKFFGKQTSGGLIKNKIMSNEKLAEELHKAIIRKIKKRKVRSQ